MGLDIEGFLAESNRIENIFHVKASEIEAARAFLELPLVTTHDLQKFVSATQPNARLREHQGMDVQVGGYFPPPGGPMIRTGLDMLLSEVALGASTAFDVHLAYEGLHPFTDGNGRSGRMLWLWQTRSTRLPFLQSWYYQTLGKYGTSPLKKLMRKSANDNQEAEAA